MAFAFDTLGYAKRLEQSGVQRAQAEAHAEAERDFVMAELVTKSDLASLRANVDRAIDAQTLRLTTRLGGLIVAGIGILAALVKLI